MSRAALGGRPHASRSEQTVLLAEQLQQLAPMQLLAHTPDKREVGSSSLPRPTVGTRCPTGQMGVPPGNAFCVWGGGVSTWDFEASISPMKAAAASKAATSVLSGNSSSAVRAANGSSQASGGSMTRGHTCAPRSAKTSTQASRALGRRPAAFFRRYPRTSLRTSQSSSARR